MRKIVLSLVATAIAAVVAGGIAYATGAVGSSTAPDKASVEAAGPYTNVPTRQYVAALAARSTRETLASYKAAVVAAGAYSNVPTPQYLAAVAANSTPAILASYRAAVAKAGAYSNVPALNR